MRGDIKYLLLEEFIVTIKEAAEYYNICRQHINKSCQGKIKYCGKHPVTGEKLVWRYIDGKD